MLLKNDGALPLRPGARVALIGALADDRANMLGTWAVSGDPAEAPTLLEALREVHDGDVIHAKGSDLTDDPELVERLNVFGPIVHPDDRPEAEMIAEAVAEARAADVVVLVAGEAKEHSGESSSTTDIGLSATKRLLIEAVKATGTPLVLVILTGRPMALERETEQADALLYGWFGGTEGASGLADALTGRTPPAGRLAATLPRRTGQIPVHHGAAATGRPWRGRWEKFRTGYLDLPAEAHPSGGLHPFGFGLSYTRFEWRAPQADRTRLDGPDDRLTVTVQVANVGDREGAEVVQLYVTDPEASVVRPSQELRGFEKLRLAPGETAEARFTLTADDLSFIAGESLADARRVFEPGRFLIHVGPNSRDLRTIEVEWTL